MIILPSKELPTTCGIKLSFASFQLHPEVTWTAKKTQGFKFATDWSGEGDSTRDLSISQATNNAYRVKVVVRCHLLH